MADIELDPKELAKGFTQRSIARPTVSREEHETLLHECKSLFREMHEFINERVTPQNEDERDKFLLRISRLMRKL